ncbi:hypothetical protein AR457_33685 [Streptomyces agglomeratus]|uniref:hypothetical protein n=1 Tax=Streptomyces agglomeratus TaxID=285458 RepID=UPI000854A784|nr:hypothetical protein [Streptomyces agglomeratus]OEJ36154.1 hypothetical protein AR457_35675 [Streptomyces agglomeratus]OEJ42086.1 hypothetical protein BGK70_02990 [Streptomyces agglomeratus]OEJ49400.1 hypothetical protein AR457_33685 [Streptomyces agglomeratus]OEJ55394.1 hypothetical protein BGK72_02520 [Streptomyces agglomeratus]OEJ62768.1 hypothetical protein BGM19_03105 [Streptomyces agglomeratus]
MAQVVRRQRVNAYLGYFAFGLQDSDDAALPVPFPDDFARGVFVGSHPGRLDITSGGHTHTATVDVEVWDAAPPPQDPAGWDEQAEADLESTSGQLVVWSMHTGRTDDVITLAESGGSWQVRVSCSGRAEAAALSEGEGTGVGVERYLLQFWPADA